ncbi:microcin C transport system substrate-binding protein [Kushneria avicenniae]|uniref:Microcin C transport system substrate-binding protein n=1 Tax=Kushneria avicenniae TaxID=402385 RepID=A0A1I1FM88_9GAMM|nr:extracellular solute-binding protein [Kushneria avicenniae]SFC00639.1 microcin C transport system substrate-binding protein [Kushneria avicenniae]
MSRMTRWHGRLRAGLVMGLFACGVQAAPVSDVPTVHGISLYDAPALPDDFDHFPWVNAQAPKGGDMVRAAQGSFDSLNPFIVRGDPASGLTAFGGLPFDTLMVESPDEPFTLYGLLAAGIRLDPDRRWMEIDLDSRARFHDGSPVTAEDVVTTFETLKTKGSPMYRAYYADVTGVEMLSPSTVRFEFSEHNSRELPLIVGQLPVLSASDIRSRDITRPTLDPLMGSGPYRIASVQPGQRIVYQRDDYWGKNLPVNRGRYNIDRLIFDYYRDPSVAFTAFRAGRVDLRVENIARNWVTGYDFPAARQGLVKRVEVEDHNPAPMQGFVMNLRRDIFKDRRVRQALGLAFDFDWLNRNLFYGLYARTRGFFDHSSMEARGLPSAAERALLAPWRDRLPEEVFKASLPIKAPEALRPRLKEALSLLRDAGYEVRDNRMVNRETGRPLRFELLLSDSSLERMALPMVRNLARLGIEVNLRTVDPSQYLVRLRQFDFDMTTTVIAQSTNPGNEQREYWGSEYADQPQSRNLMGIDSPAVDDLINHIIRADSREALDTAVSALDRVLRWGFYVIPQYHSPVTRLAYWKKFAMPDQSPEYGMDLDSWWVDPKGARAIDNRQE